MDTKGNLIKKWLDSPLINLYQKENKHHFKIMGANKRPILSSQAFTSKKKRDQAFIDVLSNFDVLTVHKQGSRHYFAVAFSEEHDPIQSKKFASLKEMKESIAFLEENLLEKAEVVEKPAKPAPKKGKSVDREESTEARPHRYNFVINFYSAENKKGLRGKIEFPLTKETASFEGFDKDKIWKFIDQRIPAEKVEPEEKAVNVAADAEPRPTMEKHVASLERGSTAATMTMAKPIMGMQDFQFFSGIHKLRGATPTLPRTEAISLQMNINKFLPQLKATRYKYEAEVFANPFNTQNKTLIATKEEDIYSPDAQDESVNIIEVPLSLSRLNPGVTRIEVTFKMVPLPENETEAIDTGQGPALQTYGRALAQLV